VAGETFASFEIGGWYRETNQYIGGIK